MGRAAKGVRGMRVSFGSAQVEDVEDAEVDSDDEENQIQHSSVVLYR